MSKSMIIHHRPNIEPVFYLLNRPRFGEPDFYRQSVSLTAFNERELKRAFPYSGELPPIGFNWMRHAQSLEYCSVDHDYQTTRFGSNADLYPIAAEFNSVWDLYKHIEYDYKKQKYVK